MPQQWPLTLHQGQFRCIETHCCIAESKPQSPRYWGDSDEPSKVRVAHPTWMTPWRSIWGFVHPRNPMAHHMLLKEPNQGWEKGYNKETCTDYLICCLWAPSVLTTNISVQNISQFSRSTKVAPSSCMESATERGSKLSAPIRWNIQSQGTATTPGTPCPTLCEECVSSLTSKRITNIEEFWDGHEHRILTQCTAKDLNSHGDATSPGPRMDSNHSSSYGRDYGIVDNCVPVTVAREILQKQFQDTTSLNRSISQ